MDTHRMKIVTQLFLHQFCTDSVDDRPPFTSYYAAGAKLLILVTFFPDVCLIFMLSNILPQFHRFKSYMMQRLRHYRYLQIFIKCHYRFLRSRFVDTMASFLELFGAQFPMVLFMIVRFGWTGLQPKNVQNMKVAFFPWNFTLW